MRNKGVITVVDFSAMPSTYWSETTKISYLQRRIIVYSIMYYTYHESCISDKEYDSISRQLYQLQQACTQEQFECTQYFYVMYDFDGNTGFDIPSRLTEHDREYLGHIASNVYHQWQAGKTRKVV